MIFLIAICLSSLNLIPEPKEVIINDGQFTIKPSTGIFYDSSVEGLLDAINYAVKNIRISTGYSFQYKNSTSINQINFVKSTSPLESEGYTLTVTTDSVTITSTTPVGFLYGYETFLQLLPKYIPSKPSKELTGHHHVSRSATVPVLNGEVSFLMSHVISIQLTHSNR